MLDHRMDGKVQISGMQSAINIRTATVARILVFVVVVVGWSYARQSVSQSGSDLLCLGHMLDIVSSRLRSWLYNCLFLYLHIIGAKMRSGKGFQTETFSLLMEFWLKVNQQVWDKSNKKLLGWDREREPVADFSSMKQAATVAWFHWSYGHFEAM